MATVYYVDSVSGGDVSPYATTGNAAVDVRDVFTQVDDPVIGGDIIYVLDTHDDRDATGHYTITGPTGDKDNPVRVICVSSLTTLALSTGAKIGSSHTALDFNCNTTDTSVIFHGMHIYAGDDMLIQGTASMQFHECTFEFNGASTGSLIFVDGTDNAKLFKDCIWHFKHINQGIYFGGFGTLEVIGGGLHASGAAIDGFINKHGTTTRPTHVKVIGVDFTGGGTTFEVIEEWAGTAVGGEASSAFVHGCLLPASGVVMSSAVPNMSSQLDARSNSSTSDNIQETLHKKKVGSVVDESGGSAIVLDATYDGTNKYSYKFVTTTDSQISFPGSWNGLRYLLAEFWAPAGSTLTVHAHHGGVTELVANQIGIEIEYPDFTDEQLVRFHSTLEFKETGTALTTETDPGWVNDLANPNYYKFAVDLSGLSPASGAGVHRVYGLLQAEAAAITAYFCPQVDIT